MTNTEVSDFDILFSRDRVSRVRDKFERDQRSQTIILLMKVIVKLKCVIFRYNFQMIISEGKLIDYIYIQHLCKKI